MSLGSISKPTDKLAKIAALKAKAGIPDTTLQRTQSLIKPEDATDKIRIIFDDSGSMSGTRIRDAKDGVIEFLRNCTLNQTAVAIHLLNGGEFHSSSVLVPILQNSTLSTDLILIASSIDEIRANGGTPLVQTCLKAIEATPQCNRMIAFSDGSPDSTNIAGLVALSKEKKIPVDTVFIGEDIDGEEFMRDLASQTGGIFLHFKAGSDTFKNGLKYLAPSKRFNHL